MIDLFIMHLESVSPDEALHVKMINNKTKPTRFSRTSIFQLLPTAVIVAGLTTLTTVGCASNDQSDVKKWQDSMILQPKQSAWIRIDADFAKLKIVNNGPADLNLRIPAGGEQVVDSKTLVPKEEYRDLFFKTRSVQFTNSDATDYTVFYYYLDGEAINVESHGPIER